MQELFFVPVLEEKAYIRSYIFLHCSGTIFLWHHIPPIDLYKYVKYCTYLVG